MVEQGSAIRMVSKDLFMVSEETSDVLGLRGMRCQDCDETFFGVRWGCELCTSGRLDEILLSDVGTIFSFTVLRVPPPGDYLGKPPPGGLVLGLVELPEGVRLLAPLDVAPDEVEVGMHVTLRLPVVAASDGTPTMTYAFEPSR